jgi:hypothetical protein
LNPRVKQWVGAGCLLLLSAGFALAALDLQVRLDAARRIVGAGVQADATVTRLNCCAEHRMNKDSRYGIPGWASARFRSVF